MKRIQFFHEQYRNLAWSEEHLLDDYKTSVRYIEFDYESYYVPTIDALGGELIFWPRYEFDIQYNRTIWNHI